MKLGLILLLHVVSAHAGREAYRYPEYRPLVEAGDYESVLKKAGNAETPTELSRAADVLREMVLDGRGGFRAPMLYSQILFVLGRDLGHKSLLETSACQALNALLYFEVDKYRCADMSAAARNLGELQGALKPMVAHLRGLPDGQRRRCLKVALQLEEATLPVREFDAHICRGGYESYSGPASDEVSAPGDVGRTVVHRSPPKEGAPSDWQASRRQYLAKVRRSPSGVLLVTGASAAFSARWKRLVSDAQVYDCGQKYWLAVRAGPGRGGGVYVYRRDLALESVDESRLGAVRENALVPDPGRSYSREEIGLLRDSLNGATRCVNASGDLLSDLGIGFDARSFKVRD